MNTRGIIKAGLTRVLIIQVVVIISITILSIMATGVYVEDVFVKRNLQSEAEHYWELYKIDQDQPLPNTNNLVGYLVDEGTKEGLPSDLKKIDVGFGRADFETTRPVVFAESKFGKTLYLIFDEQHIGRLALLFGVLPLIILIIVLCLLMWYSYHKSTQALSPIVKLARRMQRYDVSKADQQGLDLDDIKSGESDNELDTLIDSLSLYSQRVQVALNKEQRFSSDLSHELTTPLSSIKLSAELLLSEKLTKSQRADLSRIKQNSSRITSMIRAVHLLAHQQSDGVELSQLGLADFVSEQIDMIHPGLETEKKVSLELVNKSSTQITVPDYFAEVVVRNLLEYHLKQLEEGIVTVEIDGNHVIINGVGTRMDELEENPELGSNYRNAMTLFAELDIGLDIVRRVCGFSGWPLVAKYTTQDGFSTRVIFPKNEPQEESGIKAS